MRQEYLDDVCGADVYAFREKSVLADGKLFVPMYLDHSDADRTGTAAAASVSENISAVVSCRGDGRHSAGGCIVFSATYDRHLAWLRRRCACLFGHACL